MTVSVERGAHLRVAVGVLGLPGSGGPMLAALLAADEAPAAAVGDVPELLDVHVDKRSRVVVLVAADDLAGAPVDVPEPV
jgi:hypothetical protein